jgi:hypothetical protein
VVYSRDIGLEPTTIASFQVGINGISRSDGRGLLSVKNGESLSNQDTQEPTTEGTLALKTWRIIRSHSSAAAHSMVSLLLVAEDSDSDEVKQAAASCKPSLEDLPIGFEVERLFLFKSFHCDGLLLAIPLGQKGPRIAPPQFSVAMLTMTVSLRCKRTFALERQRSDIPRIAMVAARCCRLVGKNTFRRLLFRYKTTGGLAVFVPFLGSLGMIGSAEGFLTRRYIRRTDTLTGRSLHFFSDHQISFPFLFSPPFQNTPVIWFILSLHQESPTAGHG